MIESVAHTVFLFLWNVVLIQIMCLSDGPDVWITRWVGVQGFTLSVWAGAIACLWQFGIAHYELDNLWNVDPTNSTLVKQEQMLFSVLNFSGYQISFMMVLFIKTFITYGSFGGKPPTDKWFIVRFFKEIGNMITCSNNNSKVDGTPLLGTNPDKPSENIFNNKPTRTSADLKYFNAAYEKWMYPLMGVLYFGLFLMLLNDILWVNDVYRRALPFPIYGYDIVMTIFLSLLMGMIFVLCLYELSKSCVASRECCVRGTRSKSLKELTTNQKQLQHQVQTGHVFFPGSYGSVTSFKMSKWLQGSLVTGKLSVMVIYLQDPLRILTYMVTVLAPSFYFSQPGKGGGSFFEVYLFTSAQFFAYQNFWSAFRMGGVVVDWWARDGWTVKSGYEWAGYMTTWGTANEFDPYAASATVWMPVSLFILFTLFGVTELLGSTLVAAISKEKDENIFEKFETAMGVERIEPKDD